MRDATTTPCLSAALLLALSACGSDAPTNASGAEAAGTAHGAAAIEPAAAGEAWFTEEALSRGLHFTHDAGLSPEKHLPETMGAGAAIFDADGDGDLDLYLVQGGPLPGLPHAGARPVNRLYLNDGAGVFTDATAASGAAAHDGYGMGVAVADVEGDGDLDLYVSNFGPDVLLLNDGTGRFTDGTAAAGLHDERWTTAATFFDADGDGAPDLFVTGYVQVDVTQPLWCGERRPGWRSACHPDHYAGLPPRFWRNRGDGTFYDATEAAGLQRPPEDPGKGLGAIAFDLEPDGDHDLYVANDSVENKLWINAGDGSFGDGTLLSGTGVDGNGRTEAGMGLASGDVDGDGDEDLFVTNFDDESNTLYRNEGGGLFSDATIVAGLEAPSRLPVGFGTVLADFDADGDLDLAVTNGHIIDNIHLYNDGKSWRQRPQLFANDGAGHFTELHAQAGAFVAEPLVGRGLYAADLDGDLDLDLLLTECGGRARLYVNRLGGRAVTLRGLRPGTRVEARLDDGRRLVRQAGQQSSYLGPSEPHLLLGLGEARLQRLLLRAPDGARLEHVFPTPTGPGAWEARHDGGRTTLRPVPPDR